MRDREREREREREARSSATSQEFPKWQSRHHPPSLRHALSHSRPLLSPPEHSELFRPLVQPPILLSSTSLHPPRSAMSTLLHSRARLSGCCTLFTPFHGVRGLYFRLTVKVNGTTSRGELPRRLTGTPNRNFNAYACPRVYTRHTRVMLHTHAYTDVRCARARLSKLQSIVYVFEDGGCGDAYVAYVAAREYRNEVSYSSVRVSRNNVEELIRRNAEAKILGLLAINRSSPVDDVRLSRPRLHRARHLLRLEIDRAARRLPCLRPLYAFIVYKRGIDLPVGRLEMSGFAPGGRRGGG